MDQQNRRRSSRRIGVGGILLRVALVLLCLVLLSVYLMKGLYARYQTTGSGSDSARVAKFDVVVSGTPSNSNIVCTAVNEGNGTYTITIENKSEVAVHYDLSVKFAGNDTGVTPVFSPESGDLAAGATGSSTLTLTVNWEKFTSDKKGSSASVDLSFTVTVDVTQID